MSICYDCDVGNPYNRSQFTQIIRGVWMPKPDVRDSEGNVLTLGDKNNKAIKEAIKNVSIDDLRRLCTWHNAVYNTLKNKNKITENTIKDFNMAIKIYKDMESQNMEIKEIKVNDIRFFGKSLKEMQFKRGETTHLQIEIINGIRNSRRIVQALNDEIKKRDAVLEKCKDDIERLKEERREGLRAEVMTPYRKSRILKRIEFLKECIKTMNAEISEIEQIVNIE